MAAARQWKDRLDWRALLHMLLNEFHAAIFAWPVFFQTVLWWLSPGEGLDAVK